MSAVANDQVRKIASLPQHRFPFEPTTVTGHSGKETGDSGTA